MSLCWESPVIAAIPVRVPAISLYLFIYLFIFWLIRT